MPSPVLQFKRGLLANLPGLRNGEPGFTTDSYELYIGINSTTQENKFFGSHRYWTRETASTGSGINLVEGTSNGSSFITLKSPGSLAGITTYTFPASPIAANVLTTDADGGLSWTAVVSELSIGSLITGIGTFTNNVGFTTTTDNTLGNENTGAVQLDGGMGIAKNLTVKQNLHVGGYAEFVGVVTFKGGTINIGDGNTDDINVGGEFISSLLPNTDDAHDLGITTQRWRTLNVVNVNTTNISASGISTFTGLVDANGGLDVTGHTLLNNTLVVTGVSTFTGAIDANGGADISGGETTLSSATVSDLTSGRVVLAGASGALQDSTNLTFSAGGLIVGSGGINVTGVSTFSTDLVVGGDLQVNGGDVTSNTAALNLFNATVTTANVLGAGTDILFGATTGITTVRNNLTVGGDLRINGNDIQASDGVANITLTSNTLTAFAGDIRVNGNDIQASDGNANITLTSNTLTTFAGDIKVGGNDIQASDGTTAITLSGADVTIAGDLRINGNDIKASDGTTAITLAGNDVTVADDLTVSGNLYVNGSTTQVNTAALTVEDRTIELGVVNGAAPASATTWDLGVLFNYHATTAKKSAVIWEHADARFKFASVLAADTDGSNVNTPQLTVTTFAPIEIGQLWVNDCAGSSQVISCTGTTRNLENITVDCGSF
jgi:hypothetical protein